MDTDTLDLFCDIAGKLNFARVAEDRGVDPSSVSRTIRQLENDLGVRLFHRTTRRMALTEAGRTFHRRANRILEELEAAREEAQQDRRGPTGILRMTASVTFGERVLMPLLPAFRKSYGNVGLELVFTDANLDYVAEGVDIGIRLGADPKGDLVVSRLFDTRYHVCASPAYLADAPALQRPEDLGEHSCLLFTLAGFRSAWRFRDVSGTVSSVPVSGDISASCALNLRTAVLSGLGPALLPDWLVGADLAAGTLIDPFPAHHVSATGFDTAAWLLYPSKAHLPRKVRVMIDFLKARIRRAPGQSSSGTGTV